MSSCLAGMKSSAALPTSFQALGFGSGGKQHRPRPTSKAKRKRKEHRYGAAVAELYVGGAPAVCPGQTGKAQERGASPLGEAREGECPTLVDSRWRPRS